jgi:hypothetical protein
MKIYLASWNSAENNHSCHKLGGFKPASLCTGLPGKYKLKKEKEVRKEPATYAAQEVHVWPIHTTNTGGLGVQSASTQKLRTFSDASVVCYGLLVTWCLVLLPDSFSLAMM